MEETYTIYAVGDQAITFSFGNAIEAGHHGQIVAISRWFETNRFAGLLDVVVAYSAITVIFDLYQVKLAAPGQTAFNTIAQKLREAYGHATAYEGDRKLLKIPVCYERPFAPDLDYIAARQGITVDKVVGLHCERIYTIYMIGFLPGFPYMAEVDGKIAVPRKEKPRARVDAGSVGIAGVQTGIYPVVSPGGWQIIGRTPVTLFDKNAVPPAKLEAGNRVQFYAISHEEFNNFQEGQP